MELRNSVGTAVDVVICAARLSPDKRKTYANAVSGEGEADGVMDDVPLPLPLLDGLLDGVPDGDVDGEPVCVPDAD